MIKDKASKWIYLLSTGNDHSVIKSDQLINVDFVNDLIREEKKRLDEFWKNVWDDYHRSSLQSSKTRERRLAYFQRLAPVDIPLILKGLLDDVGSIGWIFGDLGDCWDFGDCEGCKDA